MERVTISLDESLLAQFDAFIRRQGYENRSEAVRDLLRGRLEQDHLALDRTGPAVGCLSYVYNHHQRELARRLTSTQHAHHELVLTTLHVHLDHDNCLEVAILRGEAADLQHFAEETMAETGVRHGQLHLLPSALIAGSQPG